MDNNIYINGEIGVNYTINEALMDYQRVKDSEVVNIYINSPGGFMEDGLEIANLFEKFNGVIRTFNSGDIASIAVNIFLIAKDNNRFFNPEKGRILIHYPWASVEGNADELEKIHEELRKQENELVKGLSKKLGVDEEILRGYMKQERYLNEQEIKSLNIAQIVTNRELKAVAKIKLDMNNEEMKKELSGISKLLSEIKAMFSKNETKALVIQDVEGNEIDFPDIETEEQIQTELTANIDGSPANGEYVLEDGRTLKFESGTLIEIMETEGSEPSELEVLKEELATLRAEKESAEALVKQKDEDHNALQKEFNEFKANSNTKLEKVEKEFTKFKAKFSKDFTPQGGPEGDDDKKTTRRAFKRKED